jgi:antitoxin (DNA-binding transcriptional repressor) of toxin-antitoxin stability system
MVAERLTVEDLAGKLSEVLERARSGERFAIERDGELIAEIVPSMEKSGTTLRELAVELARLPRLDDDFAADVEATRKILLPADPPKWADQTGDN